MRISQPEVLVIRRQGRGHGGVGTADPLQRQRDLGVSPVQLVTTVAADDLEGIPEATFPRALREQNRLTPDARRNAVPGLTSDRDGHNITGLSAAPRIAGMPPAPRPDVLRTANGPGTGPGMRRRGAHLDPHISSLCHCRGLEQLMSPASMAAGSVRRQMPAGRRHDRPAGLRPRVFSSAQCLASSVPVLLRRSRRRRDPRERLQGSGTGQPPGPLPDFIYDRIRQWIRSRPTVSQTAPPAPHHIVVPVCRSGGQGQRAQLRRERTRTACRALRSHQPTARRHGPRTASSLAASICSRLAHLSPPGKGHVVRAGASRAARIGPLPGDQG